MKILFTGASGYLGRYVAPRLALDHEVVGTYLSENAPLEGVRLVSLNLENVDAIRRLLDSEAPDLIVHAAAISQPGNCNVDPAKTERVNVDATRLLAENAKRMIFISTDLVFDGTKPPYRESDPVSPTSVYARSKVNAECAVFEACEESIILRLSLGYGWKPVGKGMFCDQLYRNIRSGEGMDLFSDQFRTALYMKDMAEFIARIVKASDWPTGKDRLFHSGGRETLSRVEFGRVFCEAMKIDDTKIRVTPMAEKGVDAPPDCSLNSSRLIEFTGFTPRLLREAVADMALEIP
ncbi:MAG: hypothetical protein COB53_11800 [Elusimicrobia bacterium]|nr:MAG: hypothetical protein COB53_11800 [Elusimicrobiota bacterium]